MKKNKSKKLITTLAVFVLMIFVAFWVWRPQAAEAAWFDDNFPYRNAVPVTSHTAAENNVYISTTIDTSASGQFQADCGDLRFTDYAGNLLPYYISSGCASASTVVHVFFDTMPAGAQNLYYYYGNPTAQNGFNSADFATQAASYAVGTIGSQEKGGAPVAYWKFDEGTGTTTVDASTNKLSGSISNGTWLTDDLCTSGKCLSYNGTNSVVSITDNSIIEPTNISFSAWFKTADTAANAFIYKVSTAGGNPGYVLGMNYTTSNKLECWVGSGTWFAGTSTINDNRWHYGACTYDGSTVKIYVDGKLETSTAASGTIPSTANLTIGQDSINNYYVQAIIDEVRIYNYARTAAQVKADFAARGAQKGSSTRLGSSSKNSDALSNGLVGYWKMDEASWTNNCSTTSVTDSSGNSNNGRSCPNTTGPTGGAVGKFGNGGSFDGSDDYLDIPDNATLKNFTSMTVSLWFNATNWTNQQVLISKDGNSGWYWEYVAGGTNNLGFYVSGSIKGNVGAPSTGAWHHVVATYDGSNINTYLDGALQTGGTLTGTMPSSTGSLFIGALQAGFYRHTGSIDEVRVYNRALSGKEVRDLYNWAPGPVGYWNFEEGSGGNANDISGNGNTGTATGTTVTSGKYGKGRNFNGSSDGIDAGNGSTLGPGYIMTVSAWVYRTTGGSTFSPVVDKGRDNYGGWSLSLNETAGKAVFKARLGGTNRQVTANTAYPLNQWVYISGVYDGSTMYIYQNGVLDNTFSASGSIGNPAISVRIGRANDSNFYSGLIDEVKIYNYARTAKQIVEDMNAGHPAGGSPVGSQVGYWKFDEGYGTTAFNSGAGSSLNGTITGATWNQNGKFGKALNFDGVNDSVSKSSPSGLPTGSAARTISMWINPTNTNPGGVLLHYGDGPTTGQEFIVMMQTISGTTYLFTDGDNGSNNLTVSGSEIPSSGQWSHFVFTVDGSSNWKYYLNGKYTKGGTFAVAINTVTPTSLDIGVRESSTGYFPGMIDEVKIYNYALTQDEVALDYAHGAAMNFGTLSDTSGLTGGSSASSSATASYCVPGSTDTCSAPGGEWNFEEKTGSTVYDSSGNGLTGTFLATPIWTSGKYGSGLSFNVVGNNRVSVTDSTGSPLDVTTAYTTSAWIKPTAYGTSYHYILDKGTQLYGMYLNNSAKIIPVQNNISRTATTGTIPLNVWTYISITYDGATIKKYINGILDSSQSVVATISTDDTALIIGGTGDGSANMVIDGIRIYNYARTQAQVAWDYNQGKPVGQWKMDECQGGSVFDSSGNGNTGTISIGGTGTQTAVGTCTTSGAWYNGATGKYNSSLNFDSTDDYVDLGDPSVDDVTGAITVSAWVKPASVTGSTFRIFGDENSAWCGYTCGGYSLYISSSGIPVFIFGDNATGGNSGNWDLVSGGSALSTGTWQHIVGVWDGTTGANGMKIYVNGILKGQATAVQTRIDHSTPNTVIGAENDSVGTWRNFFNGQIDDVRVYNYALTATQVKMLYNEGAGTRFGP